MKMTDNPEVVVSSRRKLPAIWFVPLIALLIGIWMVVNHYLTRGPEITITFSTAEGIEAGKTKVKALSVDVGIVESVHLNPDLKSVTINALLDREAASLLKVDSSFWVVRPRVGVAGVSGLGTLLSGAYIELSPGKDKQGKRSFQGLDDVPAPSLTRAGLHITLLGDEAGSVSKGDPVLFHGYQVGEIESTKLVTDTQKLHATIFIETPYDSLVTSNTRFWNSSGISFQASAEGVALRTGSLKSLLLGGVAFGLPEGANPGTVVENNTQFKLYSNANSININPYQYYEEFLLLFDSSVQGLVASAPVLYRGLRIGTVVGVGFSILNVDLTRIEGRAPGIPVLIRIEPGRWLGRDTAEAKAQAFDDINESINKGMRATLKIGNLLTGARVITFDFYDDAEPASIGKAGEFSTLPTISTGLEEIQIKVANLLDKLNELPLTTVLNNVDVSLKHVASTFETANQTVRNLNNILEKKDTKRIPESIATTLDELKLTLKSLSPDSALYQDLSKSIAQLNATMRNIEQLTYTIDTKPNSLIFSKPKHPDLQPKSAQ